MFHCGCARGISFHREFLSERRTLTIRKSEQAHNGTLVLPALYRHLDLDFGSSALMSGIAAHLKNNHGCVLGICLGHANVRTVGEATNSI
jgi:hypothetical protein